MAARVATLAQRATLGVQLELVRAQHPTLVPATRPGSCAVDELDAACARPGHLAARAFVHAEAPLAVALDGREPPAGDAVGGHDVLRVQPQVAGPPQRVISLQLAHGLGVTDAD